MHANQLKQAESCWVFFSWVSPLSDPLLLPPPSRSKLMHPVQLSVACWNMPWLVAPPECGRRRETHRATDRERERDRECGYLVPWPVPWDLPAAPMEGLLLTSTHAPWIVQLHGCNPAWWVSKLCVNKSLWRIILQPIASVTAGVNSSSAKRRTVHFHFWVKLQKQQFVWGKNPQVLKWGHQIWVGTYKCQFDAFSSKYCESIQAESWC